MTDLKAFVKRSTRKDVPDPPDLGGSGECVVNCTVILLLRPSVLSVPSVL